jgi:hypothetical protein
MRHLMWIAILVASTQSGPVAYAQSDSGTKGGTYSGPVGAPPPGLKADHEPDQLWNTGRSKAMRLDASQGVANLPGTIRATRFVAITG